MSYELILPFFPEEIRTLLLDPSISDLMINGASGVYADRAGVCRARDAGRCVHQRASDRSD